MNHTLNTSFSAFTEQFTVWVMALFWKKQISVSLLIVLWRTVSDSFQCNGWKRFLHRPQALQFCALTAYQTLTWRTCKETSCNSRKVLEHEHLSLYLWTYLLNDNHDLLTKCRFLCFLFVWHITCHSKFFHYFGYLALLTQDVSYNISGDTIPWHTLQKYFILTSFIRLHIFHKHSDIMRNRKWLATHSNCLEIFNDSTLTVLANEPTLAETMSFYSQWHNSIYFSVPYSGAL